jgi:hypothetical protein
MRGHSKSETDSSWWTIGLCYLATIVLLFIREPGEFTHPQFWAEDGIVFFGEARHSGLSAVVTPYGGYYHLIQRLAAGLTSLSDPQSIPRLYFLACLGVHLLMVLLILSPRVNLPYKPLIVLAIVGAPTSNEIFLSLTNIQWIFALSQVIVLISSPPTHRTGALRDYTIVGLSGLTGPFITALLPIYVLRALGTRSRHYLGLLLLAIGCAAIQVTHSTQTLSTMVGDWAMFDYVVIFNRFFSLLFLGNSDFLSIDDYLSHTLLGVLFFAVAAYIVWRAFRIQSYPALAFLAAAVLLFLPAILKFHLHPRLLIVSGLRYYYLPSVLLIWALIACSREHLLPRALGALIVVNLILWSPSLSHDRLKDMRWKRHARCIGTKPVCKIPINPKGWTLIATTPPELVRPVS